MQIELQNILPHPLKERDLSRSEIWQERVLLDQGERVHIFAPSGSGKTTLAHILYGLRKDHSGTVSFDGREIKDLSIDDWAGYRQRHLSIIFQDLRLFEEYSGRENIQIKAQLTNTVSGELIEEMCASLGVEQLLDKPCRKMSMGERQRIAIVRALVQPFDWLVMDEPFSHIDEENISKAIVLIEKYVRKNNAGLILLELEQDSYFPYHKNLKL